MDSIRGAIHFVGSALSSVAVEIVAIGVLAGLGYLFRRYIPRHWRELLSRVLMPWRRQIAAGVLDYPGLRALALSALRGDQSVDGPHYGQFGKGADPKAEEKHQTGAEDIAHKPRIYLTSWPASILSRRNQLRSNVALAIRGMEALLRNGNVRVAQTSGPVGPTQKSFLISYRHTIGAGLMLVLVRGWSPREMNILGEMLDRSAHWQNKDGGWAQCDRIYTKSDLWASAYAARYLHVATQSDDLSEEQIGASRIALRDTLAFFADEWRKHHWKYENTISEEVVLYMLIEMGAVLRESHEDLVREIVDHVRQWIGPGGGLTNSYVQKCEGESRLALQTRMAYALHQAGEPPHKWVSVFDQTLQHPRENANAAEFAFMLDMTFLATEYVSAPD